jgi:hypothetical protein
MIGKIWSLQGFEMLKAFVFFGSKHHHGGFAVLGHSGRALSAGHLPRSPMKSGPN